VLGFSALAYRTFVSDLGWHAKPIFCPVSDFCSASARATAILWQSYIGIACQIGRDNMPMTMRGHDFRDLAYQTVIWRMAT